MRERNAVLLIIFTLAVVFSVYAVSTGGLIGPDTWWHMSSGREIIKNTGVPETDTFSYTGTPAWYTHEWLFDVFIYSLVRLAGPENLKFFKFFMVFIMAFISFLVIYKRQKGKYITEVMIFVLPALFLVAPYLTLRPHLFSFVFILYFLYVLESRPSKRNRNLYFSLPVITLLWVNIHAAAFIGVVLTVIYLLYYWSTAIEVPERKEQYFFRMMLIAAGGVIAASTISPLGIKGIYFFAEDMGLKKYIMEWQHSFKIRSPEEARYFVIFYIYSAVLLFALLYNSKGANVGRRSEFVKDLLVVLLFGAASFIYRKNIPVFVILSFPVLCYYFYLIFRWDVVWARQWTERNLQKFNLALLPVLIAVLSAYGIYKLNFKDKYYFPEGAAAYIGSTDIPKNLFHPFEWGGYLEYLLYPEYKIMVNGRINAPFDVVREQSGLFYGRDGYEGIISKYSINSFLLPSYAPLIDDLVESGYGVGYFDDKVYLFVNSGMTDRYFRHVNPVNMNDFYDGKNLNGAIEELAIFLEKNPSQKGSLMLSMLYEKRNTEEAFTYIEDTLDDFPGYDALRNFLGMIYYNEKSFDRAVEVWEESEKVSPEIRKLMDSIKAKK